MPEVLPGGQEVEELLKELAAAYGECLWDWSCIETELFWVFMAASGLDLSVILADIERQETLRKNVLCGQRIRNTAGNDTHAGTTPLGEIFPSRYLERNP